MTCGLGTLAERGRVQGSRSRCARRAAATSPTRRRSPPASATRTARTTRRARDVGEPGRRPSRDEVTTRQTRLRAGEMLTYTLDGRTARGPPAPPSVPSPTTLPGAGLTCPRLRRRAAARTAGRHLRAGHARNEASATVRSRSGRSTRARSPTRPTSPRARDPIPRTTPRAPTRRSTRRRPVADEVGRTRPGMDGEQLTYTLTATTPAPDATGVALTDTLPGGVTFDSAIRRRAPAPSRPGHLRAWDARGRRDGHRHIKVTPAGPGTLTNEASVTSELADPTPRTAARARRRPSTRRPTCR